MTTFQVGDKVRFKSGGFNKVVEEPVDEDAKLLCRWWENGEWRNVRFPAALVELVDRAAETREPFIVGDTIRCRLGRGPRLVVESVTDVGVVNCWFRVGTRDDCRTFPAATLERYQEETSRPRRRTSEPWIKANRGWMRRNRRKDFW